MGPRGRARMCTLGSVKVGGRECSILDSIVGQVRSSAADVRVENCDVYGAEPFWDLAKPGRGCFRVDPQFRDPANLDFRLKPTSPCRKRASDGGDLGCRYTKEMLEMIAKALELRRRGIIKF